MFGAGTAVIAALLVLFQTTEFAVKVAILSSLTVSCALVPLLSAARAEKPGPGDYEPNRASAIITWSTRGLRRPAVLAATIIALAAAIDTIALSSDSQIGYIEQGLTGTHNPQ